MQVLTFTDAATHRALFAASPATIAYELALTQRSILDYEQMGAGAAERAQHEGDGFWDVMVRDGGRLDVERFALKAERLRAIETQLLVELREAQMLVRVRVERRSV